MTEHRRLGWFNGLLSAIARCARSITFRTQFGDPPTPPGRRPHSDEARARMLAALPYPRVEVPGALALAEWERLRAEGRGWPVIVGNDEQLEAIAELFSLYDEAAFPTPAAILAEAATLSLPEVLAQRVDADPDWPAPPLGEWPAPGAVGRNGLTVASEILSGKPFPRVHILLIPTAHGWEVPAYLRWGGWNGCPAPAEHVAALRHWHERFGVEPIGLHLDTLNLRAVRRPADRAGALALAREHYSYCPDVVDQGVGSLSALAALLLADDWWFFWWD